MKKVINILWLKKRIQEKDQRLLYHNTLLRRKNLIQKNPFYLSSVDELFYNTTTENNINEKIILEYFQYIKNRLYKDSIFRLLSPLLNIFFCFPNSKKFKTEIQSIMKDKKIDVLESLFLQFIDNQQINMNF